jgi:hypothetical protein
MPIVSIIVPTHNRARYAKSCIEAVLGIDDRDLQLVMTDTSIDPELFDWLHRERPELLDDQRFVYRRIEGPSDVTQNHNEAFALATGEFVGVIGDDDFVTAALPDALRWASANGVQAISQTLPAVYAWPDFQSRLSRSGHAGRLYVPRGQGGLRWRDAEADLLSCLQRAFQGTDQMPRTYHGFVRRELLEKARACTGAYVHGSSPDMSGSVAVAAQIERYCEVDLPLTVPGISGGSNSGRSALNTHKGDLSSDAQTRKFVEAGWPAGLPRLFSVETVWAHAGMATLRHFRPEMLAQFNYARLIALCTLRHPDYPDAIAAATDEARAVVGPQLDRDVAREIWRERRHRAWYLLRRGLIPTAANGRRFYKQLADVAQASACYENHARKAGFAFAALVHA